MYTKSKLLHNNSYQYYVYSLYLYLYTRFIHTVCYIPYTYLCTISLQVQCTPYQNKHSPFWAFPYSVSVHQVFFLHVLWSCVSSVQFISVCTAPPQFWSSLQSSVSTFQRPLSSYLSVILVSLSLLYFPHLCLPHLLLLVFPLSRLGHSISGFEIVPIRVSETCQSISFATCN